MNQKIKEKKKSKNNHNARNITIMISIFLLAIIIGILIMQRYVFFYPWHDKDSYNTLKTNTSFQEITIESNGQKLNGWLKYNTDKNKKSPLLIFFGGNMQNSSNAMLYFENSNKYNYFDQNELVTDEYGNAYVGKYIISAVNALIIRIFELSAESKMISFIINVIDSCLIVIRYILYLKYLKSTILLLNNNSYS